jgi:hypothetical protein
VRGPVATCLLTVWRSTAGFLLCLLAVPWGLTAVGCPDRGSGIGPFREWANDALARGQPAWKARVLQGNPGQPVAFKATWYARSEGETVGAWCKGGRSIALRWGHVAADWEHWPPGSVFWSPRFRCLFVVVDKGGKVTGPRRVDVYIPDGSAMASRAPLCEGHLVLLPLGRVSWEEAR